MFANRAEAETSIDNGASLDSKKTGHHSAAMCCKLFRDHHSLLLLMDSSAARARPLNLNSHAGETENALSGSAIPEASRCSARALMRAIRDVRIDPT